MHSSQGRVVERKFYDPVGTVESLPIAWVSTILIMSLRDPETKMFPDKQKEVTAPNHRGGVITEITKRKSGPKFCVSWQKRQSQSK